MKIVFQTGTDSAVNANQLSIQVEKRAAGITANQLAVRLNDAVLEGNHPPQAHHRAAFPVQPPAVPQREHPVPHTRHFFRFFHAGQFFVQLGCDFGHAGVRIAVLRRGFSRKARSIRQDDFERGSFLVHNVGR